MRVGVAISSIPPRHELLARALRSVDAQTRRPDVLTVAVDYERAGAAVTRNRAWRALGDVDYVAFLDDDDEFGPDHLARLVEVAVAEDADLVYPWFTVSAGTDPFPMHFGRAWDPDDPRQTTITCLWRREALEVIDGFPDARDADGVDEGGNRAGEDFLAVCTLNAAGGKIVHLAERTWIWHHDTGNTSGLPDRW